MTAGIQQVRAALERGEKLTHRDALQRFGLMSLAVAIHTLKARDKLPIQSRLIMVDTAHGDRARVAEYWLGSEGQA